MTASAELEFVGKVAQVCSCCGKGNVGVSGLQFEPQQGRRKKTEAATPVPDDGDDDAGSKKTAENDWLMARVISI